jgi:hypothetical protein
LEEETGLIKPPESFRHIYTLNCKKLEMNYHSISCIMYNEVDNDDSKKIRNAEPEKCSGWFWISFNEMRDQIDGLFHPLKDFLNKFPDLNTINYLKKIGNI